MGDMGEFGGLNPIEFKFPKGSRPVKDGGKVKQLDLEEELGIDDTDINNELAQQPAKFAWYAAMYEHAKNIAAQRKMELEELRAELDAQVREAGAATDGLRLTEALISNTITQTQEFQDKQREMLEAQKVVGLLGVAKEAFIQRANMLISLCANKRVEVDSEITTLKDKLANRQ